MLALINYPITTLYKLLPEVISLSHIQFDDSMTTRHICPCCSSILLRHISCSRVYWRCTHCHAPMSVWLQFE
jgi:hypothetical protein